MLHIFHVCVNYFFRILKLQYALLNSISSYSECSFLALWCNRHSGIFFATNKCFWFPWYKGTNSIQQLPYYSLIQNSLLTLRGCCSLVGQRRCISLCLMFSRCLLRSRSFRLCLCSERLFQEDCFYNCVHGAKLCYIH